MSDGEPPSRNPFIRFKQHIDSRINSGFSVITRGPRRPETATYSTSSNPELPRPDNASMATGAPNPFSWTCTESATRRYWNEWVESSPYSPYNLHHLEPPVPAGVTPGDSHLFGFEDAFEDLMATVQGGPMMNLQAEANLRRGFYKVVPFGEPPQLWVDRLIRRRLLPPPPPAPSADGNDPHQFVRESEILKGVAAQQDRLAAIQSQRQAKTASSRSPEELMQYIEETKEKLLKELDKDFTFNPATVLRQLEESFKQLEKDLDPAKMFQQLEQMIEMTKVQTDRALKKLDETTKTGDQVEQALAAAKAVTEFDFDKFLNDMEHREESSKPSPKAQDKQKPQPDTEEDFFSAIFGALMDNSANRSAGSATDKVPDRNTQVQQDADDERHTVEENEHGGKTHRWTSVTNLGGQVIEDTEVEVLDAQGRTVSHEIKAVTRTGGKPLMRSAARDEFATQLKLLEKQNKARWGADDARQGEVDAGAKASEGSQGKKSLGGWFWR